MHEFSVAQSLAEIVLAAAQEQGMYPVRVVRLRIGKLTCIDPDALAFAYEQVVTDTHLKDSRLEIIQVEPQAACLDCSNEYDFPEDFSSRCPKCGGIRIEIRRGRELMLESLEGEISDGSENPAEHSQSQ